ncbi:MULTISPECIES: ketoacyl-ACP synthase III [unclassified Paenibacillus]|uniref:ketoacyl-ACP synthase III n=1 Tax=unclassified Paenibacillus TaxID=185978 RepID=UPI00278ACAA5|nr:MULTISPECIES: ketoacyl-ACP synthase III [unclassified Paenibacillus]MDQ0901539.1 3-oxoacyl-[acyl-carrier-protein] synthase-3 [Paenibacillus sp. V4I7]MDQ0919958.1 3-oxoacyl-[acyl-carrier-protein] synthase-3 [Paenibacillus sp. V4I5]
MAVSSPLQARITAIGGYVPHRILSNADLQEMVDTNDEWIVQRTGIRERRIAEANEFTSHLCIAAVQNMLTRYPTSLNDVDLIIVATHTPDLPSTPVACQIQAHFGIPETGAYDLNATCSGFAYALHTASGLVAAGVHRKVLVVGGDSLSKITDYTDRSTCILFGDGAGAVIVEREEENPAFLAHYLGSDGTGSKHVYRTGLASELNGTPLTGEGKLVQNGREVYKYAVTTVPQGIEKLLTKSRLPITAIDWFIPHSANLRIIESVCEKSGIPFEKALYSLEYYGNTSAASIPLALDLGIKEGKVTAGDTLLIFGFGGGLTHAGLILRWG